MAFEPIKNDVATSTRQRVGTTQAVIECKLPANEGSEINKILCANAKAYIANTKVGEGEIDFDGFANFVVVYETADSTESLDYSAEFKDRYKNSNIKFGDIAIVEAHIVDVNTTKATSMGEIKVVAVVEIVVDTISTQHTNVVVDVQGQDVFTQTENLQTTALASHFTDRFEIGQELEIKDSVQQILSVCLDGFLDSAMPHDGYATLKGNINATVIYLTNTETPELRTYQENFNFTHEVADNDLTQDSVLQSSFALLNNELNTTTNLGDNNAVLSLVIPAKYHGYVFNTTQEEVVTDMFSLQNEITSEFKNIASMTDAQTQSYAEKISGNVVTDENTPFIDEVIGSACNNVVLASNTIDNNRLIVEGIAYTTVLYYNKEFNNNNSLEMEIPFSLSLPINDVNSNAQTDVSVSLGEVSVRSKRGTELDVTATVFVLAEIFSQDTQRVMVGAELGEEKGETDCVLSVYVIRENDTLWSIAKSLNVSPEMILDQNPQLELPLVPGHKLIVYRQEEVAF